MTPPCASVSESVPQLAIVIASSVCYLHSKSVLGLPPRRLNGHITMMLIVVVRPHRGTCQMRPIAADGVVWSVSLSVMIVSPSKVAEPITMLFGTLINE